MNAASAMRIKKATLLATAAVMIVLRFLAPLSLGEGEADSALELWVLVDVVRGSLRAVLKLLPSLVEEEREFWETCMRLVCRKQ